MADNIGLMIATGTTQGVIKASEDKRVEGDLKFADGVEVWAHTTGVLTPTDPSRLVVTGRATHTPFSVWTPTSSATPKFFQASANGEVFSSITLTYNQISTAGKPVKWYQWSLTNAIIVAFQQNLGMPTASSGTAVTDAGVSSQLLGLHDIVLIKFTFETITHTHLVANTVATASVVGASK
jgi:type VI secretion system Hcp family effector